MDHDREKPQRKNVRLKGYDYSWSGAYFVTICVVNRKCLLGEVVKERVVKSAAGEIAHQCWLELPRHYSRLTLDALVVMPNHVHGILLIAGSVWQDVEGKGLTPRSGLEYVEDQGKPRHGLPEIIRAFKSFSSREINRSRGASGLAFWQRNYFEHVIRNVEEANRIRAYIESNPVNWMKDMENPARTGEDDFNRWLRNSQAEVECRS
jgi:putative transposase